MNLRVLFLVASVWLAFLLVPVQGMGSSGAPGVNGWEALSRLQAGNQRFLSGDITWRPDPQVRGRLADGQKPFAIILSCSDSRVPPELIFDQGLGDLFIVRVAGNLADPHAIASIEYALEHLGSRLLVVMGHESCGAVKAALTTPAGQSAGSPSLDVLVGTLKRNLDGNMLFNPEDKLLQAPVRTNVSSVTRGLVEQSPVVQHLLQNHELVIAQAIYGLGSGQVTFFYAGMPEVPAHGAGGHSAASAGHGAVSHDAHGAPVHKAKPKKKKKKAHRASHSGGHAPAASHAPAPSAAAETHAAPAAAKAPAPTGYAPPAASGSVGYTPPSSPTGYTPPAAAPAPAHSAPAAGH